MKRTYTIKVDGREVVVVLKGQGVTTSINLKSTGQRLGGVSKGYKAGSWFSHTWDKVTSTRKTKLAAVTEVIEAAVYGGLLD